MTLNLPAGPYLRVEGTTITLTVLGQTLTGDFSIERATLAGGASRRRSSARNVSFSLASGSYGIGITGGAGALLVTAAGLAGELRGAVAANLPAGVSVTGSFSLLVNNTNAAVAETLTLGAETVALNVARGPFVRFSATGARLEVLGQVAQADIAFERSTVFGTGGAPDTTIFRIAIANGSLAFGGASPLLSVTGASGSILVTSTGVAGKLQGTIALHVPGVSLSGAFAAEFNTTGNEFDADFQLGAIPTRLKLEQRHVRARRRHERRRRRAGPVAPR